MNRKVNSSNSDNARTGDPAMCSVFDSLNAINCSVTSLASRCATITKELSRLSALASLLDSIGGPIPLRAKAVLVDCNLSTIDDARFARTLKTIREKSNTPLELLATAAHHVSKLHDDWLRANSRVAALANITRANSTKCEYANALSLRQKLIPSRDTIFARLIILLAIYADARKRVLEGVRATSSAILDSFPFGDPILDQPEIKDALRQIRAA